MSEISSAVQALVNRMKEAPEEFFDPKEKDRWAFIYKETFREVLTEPEKAAIHTALRDVRRKEFETKILKEILKVEEEQEHEGPASVKYKAQGRFGQAQVKGQGQPVSYWNDPRMAMQREDLLAIASENGINQIQTIGQRINGALNKMVGK
jgi:hypothetical protein